MSKRFFILQLMKYITLIIFFIMICILTIIWAIYK